MHFQAQAYEHDQHVTPPQPRRSLNAQEQQLRSFHRMIDEETIIVSTRGPGLCECGKPTKIVELLNQNCDETDEKPPQEGEFVQLLVCASQGCEFWQPHKQRMPQEEMEEPMPPSSMAPDAESIEKPEVESYSPDELRAMSIEDYWAAMIRVYGLTYLTNDEVDILIGTNAWDAAPQCECQVHNASAQRPSLATEASGDIFWVCGVQSCRMIVFHMEKPETNATDMFDQGEQASLGELRLDRYTTGKHILKNFGQVFTREYFDNLIATKSYGKGDKKSIFPPESKQLSPGDEIDQLISYRGATGRWTLWITMCAIHNIGPSLFILVVVLPLIALFIYFVAPEPIYYVSRFWFISLSWDFDAHQRSLFDSIFPMDRAWFIFVPYGSVLLVFLVWFWHPVCAYFNRCPKKIWLDKYSVLQNDNEDSIATLLRMPLYLKHSKELVCIFDEEYVTRLWCIFELAVYLRARKEPLTSFINTSQRVLEMTFITWHMASLNKKINNLKSKCNLDETVIGLNRYDSRVLSARKRILAFLIVRMIIFC